MGWGNSANKWGRKPTRDRGEVVWTDRSGEKPAPFARNIPGYSKTREIPEEYKEHMYPGALWSAQVAMNPNQQQAGGKFPVLVPCYWQPDGAVVKHKSLMVYAGVVRVNERKSNGRIVSVPRHTFVAADGRYIIIDFDLVKPVT